MAETAPLVISPMHVLEEALGANVARYRDGFKARAEWRARLNAMLSTYDDAIVNLTGDPAEVERKTKEIVAAREAAYQKLVEQNPPPPNPNDDPSISAKDRELYTLLEQTILSRALADLPEMEAVLKKFQAFSEGLIDGYLGKIRDEIEKREKADARAERKNRRTMHRSKVAGVIGQTVGGILSAIPLVVTQIIGAVISVGTAVATAAVEIDAARRLAYTLRDNANWLVYEQPLLIEEIEQEEWNLDYVEALLPLTTSMRQSVGLRQQINSEKLKAGIYDENVLASSRKGASLAWKAVFYAGLAYAAWRIIWK